MSGQQRVAHTAPAEPIAIVGIGCRLPGGVRTPAEFWQLLREGRDAIQPITRDGLEVSRFYDPRPGTPGRMMTKFGGFLEDLELFDADFFGISPREAASLDPAQRLLLETAWEALEDATIDPTSVEGKPVGVYVGQWLSDFESRMFADITQVDLYATTGSGRYATSGRLSYFLGVTGPCLTVDTACSSSLVAVHLACQSLRSGESSLALAAGVNVILQPHITIAYSQSGMMAADGRCKFGDANGDGYVRSEGAAVVVLKPLARAVADGDPIRAVIRGSAVNNDGRGGGHLATPSRAGQAAMLRSAYADAGVSPEDVGYVEAHGTGTRAGDPIELGALADVLAPNRSEGERCLVGSVKTNIGHTEGAAGLAGLIKTVLILQHREVPESLHFSEPNPAVPWAQLPFNIPRQHVMWPAGARPRTAGVSAFGITGTNAHVVLEEAPAASVSPIGTAPKLAIAYPLVLSAQTEPALRAVAMAYADRMEADPLSSLYDVCATAARHRAALDRRAVFMAHDRTAMTERLRRFAAGDPSAADASGRTSGGVRRRIAFIFPGQGGHWAGMTRELLEHEPAFREAIERCDAAMPEGLGWSVLEQLQLDAGGPGHRLHEIGVLQPTLLAVEIALAELWRRWGVTPDAVVGHSMGEVAAAYVAGGLSLPDAMRVICARSALLQRTSGAGVMALVGLGVEQTALRIAAWAPLVSIAASNGPRTTVVSGDPAGVAALLVGLEREGVFCRAVQVDVASHSALMDPLVPELVTMLRDLSPRPASLPLYSTVDARRGDDCGCGAEYWGRNLRLPVMFGATIQRMLADGIDAVIEVGPHPTLLASVSEVGHASPPLTLASLRRSEPERASLLTSLGALWASGHPVRWATLFPSDTYARVPLPYYPWQRERHWSDAALPMSAEAGIRPRAAIDETLRNWLYTPTWERLSSALPGEGPAVWLLVTSSGLDADVLAELFHQYAGTVRVVPSIEEAATWITGADAQALNDVGIVFLAGRNAAIPAWDAVSTLRTLQRAWIAARARSTPRVWWVTEGAHVLPGDTVAPYAVAHASVWGACRVLAQEHPEWWGGLVDLPACDDRNLAALAQHLHARGEEDQVALRGAERFGLRITRANATMARTIGTYPWRTDAAYLITGAFGGIAQRIAMAMVQDGARRLVLLGRSALPPRADWGSEPETTEAGRRIAVVRALEHAGASVHVIQADVADELQMRTALETYRREGWPPIAGVIHAAAIVDNRLIADMDRNTFERVLAPKLTGALVLDRLLPTLDLFVMFSSIAAFWAPAGMSNYAAANAAVDTLAQARHARGQHAISIQWGPWANVGLWEGPMADRKGADLERAGVGSLTPEQGTALFRNLLLCPEPLVAVLPMEWSAFTRARRGRDWSLFQAIPEAVAETDQERSVDLAARVRAATPAGKRTLLDGVLREVLGSVIHRPAAQLDSRRSFGSMGLDSLMALEFRNRLETALERSLPATLAWNYPTIDQLTAHLVASISPEATGKVSTQAEVAADLDSDAGRLLHDITLLSDEDAAKVLRGGR